MPHFKEFHTAASLAEAHELARRKSPRTAVLGGGTWLVGEAPKEIEAVVDVAKLGLNRIETPGSHVRIGAAVTLQTLVEHPLFGMAGSSAGLRIIGIGAEAMSGLNIRNRATIAGAICTADSASPLVTALLACDADVVTYGVRPRDEARQHEVFQVLPLSGFITYSGALLAQGAVLTEIRVPVPSPDTQSRFERVGRTPKDYPIVCAAAQLAQLGGIGGNVRVAAGGMTAKPMRLKRIEFGLEKKNINEFIDAELNAELGEITFFGDYLGSAEYRRDVARTLIRRAIMAIA
jgi:carbon-monoxide dehydrogenase medium subunit